MIESLGPVLFPNNDAFTLPEQFTTILKLTTLIVDCDKGEYIVRGKITNTDDVYLVRTAPRIIKSRKPQLHRSPRQQYPKTPQ